MTWRARTRAKAVSSKPKMRGDLGEIGKLALVHGAVGAGDVEEPVEHGFQHRRVVGEEARDVARIGVEAGDVLLGEIVDAADVPLLARRDREDAAEGVDLRAADDAVGLRHLGRERDHGDGEGGLAADFAVGEIGQHRAQPGDGRADRPAPSAMIAAMREKMPMRHP